MSIIFSDIEKLAYGFFPIAPVTAYALLRVSEKVGQNERTVFTFLAQDEKGTFVDFIKNNDGFALMTVDTVFDEKTVRVLRYINDNITEPLSIDHLAERFYISKYHMMRKFKAETGYTVHAYISNKRLLLSQQLIERGVSPTDACFRCGFRDYSVYSKAYKKMFGVSPAKR